MPPIHSRRLHRKGLQVYSKSNKKKKRISNKPWLGFSVQTTQKENAMVAAAAVGAPSPFLLRDPEHTHEIAMQQLQDKTIGTNNTYKTSEKGMTSSDYEKNLGISPLGI